MKKVILYALLITSYACCNTENPKKEDKLGDQVWEAAKQDVKDTLSQISQEVKDSDLYEHATKVGKAIDEFAHEYPWIIPTTLATSVIVMGRKAAVIALPFIIIGLKADITREKNKGSK